MNSVVCIIVVVAASYIIGYLSCKILSRAHADGFCFLRKEGSKDQLIFNLYDEPERILQQKTVVFKVVKLEEDDSYVANLQNTNALTSQLQNCCCENRQAISQVRYDMATDTCAITNAINTQTRDIMENCNANYKTLHDEIVANRMADKDETIAQLRSTVQAMNLAASQQAQNNYIVNSLRPPVNPAYIVQNPYASTGNLPCQMMGVNV